MKNIFSLDDLKVGQVWMTMLGQRAMIACLHGGWTDCPFQVRYAGDSHMYAIDFNDLDYLISK